MASVYQDVRDAGGVDALPDFDDLPLLPGLDVRHAWDVRGRDDVLGSINLVTPATVAAAATEIRSGEMFSLDLPLDLPNPPLFGRRPYEHHVVALNRNEMDDHLDLFHPAGLHPVGRPQPRPLP